MVIAAHNEGDNLLRTLESCVETTRFLDCEVLVADDASSDGSVTTARLLFPQVRIVGFSKRRGCAATKDLGARSACGEVLVFLDGHCKPEVQAVERLVNDVEDLAGRAIVTPRIAALDCVSWENSTSQVGYAYAIDLEALSSDWVDGGSLGAWGRFHESAALVGCCLALSRRLYLRLRGFDRHMVHWGIEDIDLGLKAWLMGYAVLTDPFACIGHRFRDSLDNYTVADEAIPVNQLRMARKNFAEATWNEWLPRFRSSQTPALWDRAWRVFSLGRRSVERERSYLLSRRVRDEFWFARKFALRWPRTS